MESNAIQALVMMALIIGLYLLPWIVSLGRKHKNSAPIMIINLFFGWTFIGWIACLAWSFTSQESRA